MAAATKSGSNSSNNNNFAIIETPEYQKSLSSTHLPSLIVKELQVTLQIMKVDPFDARLKWKPLRGNLKGQYAIAFRNGNYRLIYRVSLNTYMEYF